MHHDVAFYDHYRMQHDVAFMGDSMKDVKQLATEMQKVFVTSKRNDGAEYVHLKDGSPDWMTDVVHEVHGDKLPDDTVYALISRCVDAIADGGDDPQESLDEIEPDHYTNDLTGWLHARNDHVYYLTEALEESEFNDGFALLSYAQSIQIREIGSALLTALENVDRDEEDGQ